MPERQQPTSAYGLRFELAGRTLATARRQLFVHGFDLDELLSEAPLPRFAGLAEADGIFLRSLPEAQFSAALALLPGSTPYVRQRYPRHYARLDAGFDAYLGCLSGKTRSSLKRKVRRFEDLSGGTLDIREYRLAPELLAFHKIARALSAKTYQERLMDAGLPGSPGFLADLERRGHLGQARGYLLFLDGEPVSYLYTPIDDGRVLYAYLGYDPAHAAHSPGTVLQYEAMRRLMDERRFRLFDFTEGDGQHKRQFGTGSVACLDLLLLHPTAGNRTLVAAHQAFNKIVEKLGGALERYDLKARLKRAIRG